ncbi:aminotransferase class IV [Olivibacter sitiensis]|uniref:aminotransferase class IV n=1 Tax=Olivibacter sitiensis TaxID=376470 RepID=UPI0004156EBE|nr:aminotransferase class IV [Olivibacter sitiensis]
MLDQYININGQIIGAKEPAVSISNRSFRFGDGVFETMRFKAGQIHFLPYHLERLAKGMQLLQLENPSLLNTQFIQDRVAQLFAKNKLTGSARVRLQVYREGGGLYSPETNEAGFVLEVSQLGQEDYTLNKTGLLIDIFHAHKKHVDALSNLKTNNALLYVLAGAQRKKAGLDDILILNQEDFLCEALSSNIFIYFDRKLYTPAMSEGCVAGVMRRVVIDVCQKLDMEVIEAQINPLILHEADELFLTNAVNGIHWVMGYNRKRYFNHIAQKVLQGVRAYERVFSL